MISCPFSTALLISAVILFIIPAPGEVIIFSIFMADRTISGVPLSTDWAPRSELRKDIPAHASAQLRLLVDAPIVPGRYRLEMTLLQEDVAWFHERGMPIARSAQVVSVGSDGHIQADARN